MIIHFLVKVQWLKTGSRFSNTSQACTMTGKGSRKKRFFCGQTTKRGGKVGPKQKDFLFLFPIYNNTHF